MINEKFSYPELSRVTHDNGIRYYRCPETGLALPSVTTILDHGADKAFLVEWRKRIGDKEADRQSTYGKNLGSLVHTNVENHIMGIDRPAGNAPLRVLARKMSQQIIDKCLPRVDQVWGIEKALYVPELYAGTADLLGVHDGEPAIMDHKNAKKMRKREQIGDYFLQMAAYAIAHDNKYGTDIRRGVIFMVARDLSVETYVATGQEFADAKTAFLQRLSAYHTHHGPLIPAVGGSVNG